MVSPTIQPPLRTRFATEDPLEAREFIDRAYGVRLKVGAADAPTLPVNFEQVEIGEASVGELSLAFSIDCDLVGQGRCVFAEMIGGTAEYERDGVTERFRTGDVYLAIEADGEQQARSESTHGRTVTLPVEMLSAAAQLGPEEGGAAWRFLSRRPDPTGARRWRDAAKLLDEILGDPEISGQPLVVGPATRLVATVALAAFPNNAFPAPSRAHGRDARPETLRRAIAFIEENPARDISVDDVARAANVTTRAVQLAFRRHLDTTPTAYLRQVRLAEAHRRLRDASAGDGTTVSRVAAEWGFAKASRFAAHYRAAYGRPPSETLGS
jgi:AraC-like DNA-binding protein